MDAAARILLEKETITGEEFMRVIDTPAQLVGETR
jgi:hypothetical protein